MEIDRKDSRDAKRIYLDYASATPMDPRVFEAMQPYMMKRTANPGALYQEGLVAREALVNARERVADILGSRPSELVFTASGTESDNLAIFGVVKAAKKRGIQRPHVVVTTIEHSAVLEACRVCEDEGCDVSYVPVGKRGIVEVEDIENALRDETVLVSIMHANNEIGTLQPISEIGKFVRKFRKTKGDQEFSDYPYFHTDASQSPNYCEVNVEKLNVDLMTLDGSKIYGPKGVGCLYIREKIQMMPLIVGGGQERGRRSGTENVPGIIGFAWALEIADSMRERELARLTELRNFFIEEVTRRYPQAELNGDARERLPNNINFCFPGLDAEFAVIKLDSLGIESSYASACKTHEKDNSSYVIEALGNDECMRSSLRFTLGRGTTKQEIETTLDVLEKVLD